MAEGTTNSAATTAAQSDGPGGTAGGGAATQAANSQTGAAGVAGGNATANAAAQPRTYTDDEIAALVDQRATAKANGMLGSAKQAWQKESQEAAEAAKLKEQGEWQKVAEKHETTVKELADQLRSTRLDAALSRAAAAKHIEKVDIALKAIRDDIQYDAQGAPTNIEALLDALIAEVPGLVTLAQGDGKQPPASTGAAANPPRQGQAGGRYVADFKNPPTWEDVWANPPAQGTNGNRQ